MPNPFLKFKGKVRKALSRERGSSSRPADSGISTPGTTQTASLNDGNSQNGDLQITVRPQSRLVLTSAPEPEPLANPFASQALVLAQQAPPVPQPERNLWLVAREMLSQDLQDQLKNAEIISQSTATNQADQIINTQEATGIDNIIQRANQLIKTEEDKKYKVLGAKLLSSTENFKQLVDAGLEYDPTGYGKTAWGVVSFGLNWAINVKDMREFVFENSDYIARILARYCVIENMYRAGTSIGSASRIRFEEAVANVYLAVYTYVISMMRYLDSTSWGHTFHALVPIESRDIVELKRKIEDKDAIVESLLDEIKEDARRRESAAMIERLDRFDAQFGAILQPLKLWTIRVDQCLETIQLVSEDIQRTLAENRSMTRRIEQGHVHRFVVPRWQRLDFTGREDVLQEIDETFGKVMTSKIGVALTGMGGIGKSEIALQYAYTQKSSTSIFWINSQTAESLQESFISVARELGGKSWKFKAAIEHVRQWCRQSQTPWLLIFDNASDWMLVKEFILSGSQGRILLTTRDQNFATSETGLHKIRVPPLVEKDSLVLLLSGLVDDPSISREDISAWVVQSLEHNSSPSAESFQETKIGSLLCSSTFDIKDFTTLKVFSSRYLGSLPLAIVQFTAYIRDTKITLPDYIKKYEIQKSIILGRRIISVDYNESVMTTWELSYRQIGSGLSSDLLTLLGFLNPQGISVGLLKDAWKPVKWWDGLMTTSLDESKNVDLDFLRTDRDDYDFESSLARLESLSLVERIITPGRREQIIRMHSLVHDWIQLRMKPAERSAWVERSLTFLYQSLPPLIQSQRDTETEMRSERVLTHGFVAIQNAKAYVKEKHKGYTVPQDCVMLFLEIYLWYRGAEFLDMARDLSAIDNTPGSPLPSMIAAASLLEALQVYLSSRAAIKPSLKVLTNTYALNSLRIPRSEEKTWVTYAVLAARLSYDIKVLWSSSLGGTSDGETHETLVARMEVMRFAPTALERFCTCEAINTIEDNSYIDVVTICQSYINAPWLISADDIDHQGLSGPFHDYEPQIPIVSKALEHGLIEFDKFFPAYLHHAKGEEKRDLIFYLLDHSTLCLPLLTKGLLYHSTLLGLETICTALESRPERYFSFMNGLDGSSPASLAQYDRAYPWIRAIFRCFESDSGMDRSTFSNNIGRHFTKSAYLSAKDIPHALYQQHFLSCWQYYGLSNLRTQEWAWELALWCRTKGFDDRLQLWKDVAEKCGILGTRDPFTKKWYGKFWTGPGIEGQDWYEEVERWGNVGKLELVQRYKDRFQEVLGAENEWSLFWTEKALAMGVGDPKDTTN